MNTAPLLTPEQYSNLFDSLGLATINMCFMVIIYAIQNIANHSDFVTLDNLIQVMFDPTRSLPLGINAQQVVSCLIRAITLSTPVPVTNEAIKAMLLTGDFLVSAYIPGGGLLTTNIFGGFDCVSPEFKNRILQSITRFARG